MSKGINKNTDLKTVRLVQDIGPKIDWNTAKNKQLIAGILELRNTNEAKSFLRDLMTPGEIEEFANRLEAASLLLSSMQYNYITEKTGLSSTTIARIAKWLNGSLGGYKTILGRIKATHHNPPKIRKGLSLSA